MKKALLLPFLAAIACAPLSSFGQAPAPAPADTPAVPAQRPEILTPEERQTLMDAGQKARLDPAVQAADVKRHEALKAAGDAMVGTDKSLGPLIE